MQGHVSGSHLFVVRGRRLQQVKLKVLCARIVANGIALALTVWVLPGLQLSAAHPLLALLLLGAVFGVVNAIVRPFLEFLLLMFTLRSFGVVIVFIDWAVFAVFDHLAPGILDANGFLATLAGGVLMAVLSFLLDAVLGLSPPIVDDQAEVPTRGRA